jgi:hypothetical protein
MGGTFHDIRVTAGINGCSSSCSICEHRSRCSPPQSQAHEIYRIDCWRYVIHVVGKGVSTFVSYADLPPILDVEPPSPKDFLTWRKRWKKNKTKAPNFWTQFYAQKFRTVLTLREMYNWGELVSAIKSVLSEAAVKWLRSVYVQEKYAMKNF